MIASAVGAAAVAAYSSMRPSAKREMKKDLTSAEALACMVMFGECSKIKLSTEADDEYTQPYKLSIDQNQNMFYNTGGTFTGEPTSNTTYYVSNTNIVV